MKPAVSVYGAGQLGTGVAQLLKERGYPVTGPFKRGARSAALESGADVVVIATTTRLTDVAQDIETAVVSGSNVLVSAEECAYPWAVDEGLARHIDERARATGVSIAGCGVNPGLIFDALVLTALGATSAGCDINASRTVDLSKFGVSVLRRIGIGSTEAQFVEKVRKGTILGHAGFPQSMYVVASGLGITIDRIDRWLDPVLTKVPLELPSGLRVASGESAGVDQTYTAYVAGHPWFTCRFFGHVDLAATGKQPTDRLEFFRAENRERVLELRPGLNPQEGSQNMLANSIDRIVQARPGWVTVAELVPAYPRPSVVSVKPR